MLPRCIDTQANKTDRHCWYVVKQGGQESIVISVVLKVEFSRKKVKDSDNLDHSYAAVKSHLEDNMLLKVDPVAERDAVAENAETGYYGQINMRSGRIAME